MLANSRVPPTAVGNPETILIKIIIDIPFPIPFSDICSPSHIKNIVPVTRVTIVEKTKPDPLYKAIPCDCNATATPPACSVDKPRVPKRVYCVIFFLPDSPCFLISFKAGMVADINCIIIEADMYGIIPRARILKRSSAPPENILNISIIVPLCCSKKEARAAGFIPGTGIYVPILYTRIAPKTKNSLFLNSSIIILFYFTT